VFDLPLKTEAGLWQLLSHLPADKHQKNKSNNAVISGND
jgi:hypothetical protein